jgi:hypothetical protein
MSGIYTTKIPTLDTLEDVDINPSTLSNNDVIQYNSTTREWDNVVLGNPYLLTMYNDQQTKVNLPINSLEDIDFRNVDAYGSASQSDWHIVNKEWTCPVGKSGLYHFVLQAYGEDTINDSLEGWQNYIEHAPSGSNTFTKIAYGIIATGTNDDLASMCRNISRYYVVNAGDKIKARVTVRVNAGDGQIYYTDQRTFLQIVKLI